LGIIGSFYGEKLEKVFVHTTFIPYREFERVLGIQEVDKVRIQSKRREMETLPLFFAEKTLGEVMGEPKNLRSSLTMYIR
jgi:hypothetical protein